MKYLFSLIIVALLANPFDAIAQDAMYSKADYKKILESYDEIIIVMPGFDYKYTGNWVNTMEITGDNALTFTRGKVTHSYNLSTVMFLQEEGRWVKLWLR